MDCGSKGSKVQDVKTFHHVVTIIIMLPLNRDQLQQFNN
jgi:hypothetical protein